MGARDLGIHHARSRTGVDSMTAWIPWSGGECPVAGDIAVSVRFRNGREYKNQSADSWSWKHHTGTSGWEVVAYRVSADGGEGE